MAASRWPPSLCPQWGSEIPYPKAVRVVFCFWLMCCTAERTRLFVCLGGDKEEGDDGQDLRRTESDSGLKKACFPKMHYDLLGTALWFHRLWNGSTLISFWIPDLLFCSPLDLKRKAHVRAHGAIRSPRLSGRVASRLRASCLHS